MKTIVLAQGELSGYTLRCHRMLMMQKFVQKRNAGRKTEMDLQFVNLKWIQIGMIKR